MDTRELSRILDSAGFCISSDSRTVINNCQYYVIMKASPSRVRFKFVARSRETRIRIEYRLICFVGDFMEN